MRMRSAWFVMPCILAALVSIPGVALAGGLPRTHDGFFMRLAAGFGSGDAKADEQGGTYKMSGSSGDFQIAIGGAVKENLLLHATLWGWSVSDPKIEANLPGYGSMSGTASGSATMSAIGGGATYYFMPVNIYTSASIGMGRLSLDSGGGTNSTDSGLALELSAGKEWWVGKSWGLGVAGAYGYHSIPDKGGSPTWKGSSYSVRFSATLN